METNSDILIIGGGLSGLTLAYLATMQNKTICLVESQNRIGGRIETIKGVHETPMELGATWFSDEHPELLKLIEELGLKKYPQYSKGISLFQTKSFEPAQGFYIPEATQPSYRILGGTIRIIEALAERLPVNTLSLNTSITTIAKDPSGLLKATTNDGRCFTADKVFICIPPAVASKSINFNPGLPEMLTNILPIVQTWMAGSIKFTVEYEDCFWRHHGKSGMLYSHSGAITEMYDHTNFENSRFAFTGFLNQGVQHYAPKLRRSLVLSQLEDLFGPEAANPLSYQDKIWNDPTLWTNQGYFPQPHYNNGHEVFKNGYFDNRLYFAGSESSHTHPGYMEGAVAAARSAAAML